MTEKAEEVIYALCNDGTRIYLGGADSNYAADCEKHGQVGVAGNRDGDDGIDYLIYQHARSLHRGQHSHACART